jgi:Cohesin domain
MRLELDLANRCTRLFARLALPLAGAITMAGADLQLTLTPRDAGGNRDATFALHAPGEVVSGIRFDVTYDPGVVTIVSLKPADALAAQEKTLEKSEAKPGLLRVGIIGMNAYPMLNGAVMTIRFTSSNDADPFRVVNAAATSPEGRAVELIPTDGSAQAGKAPRRETSKQKKK